MEVQHLRSEQRLRFWLGIAYRVPDRWVCGICCKLHPVSSSGWFPFSRQDYDNKNCPHQTQHHDIGGQYPLQHMQLQLTLKLSARADHRKWRGYPSSLLKPCHEHGWAGFSSEGVKEEFVTHPKVIGNRLVIYSAWRWTRSDGKPCSPELLDFMPKGCPHTVLMVPQSASLRSHWEEHPYPSPSFDFIATAFARIGEEVAGHCESCATDFSIKIESAGEAVVFRCWRDLGSYASPFALSWLSQTEHDYNPRERVPKLCHKPGSVRALYQSGPHLERSWTLSNRLSDVGEFDQKGPDSGGSRAPSIPLTDPDELGIAGLEAQVAVLHARFTASLVQGQEGGQQSIASYKSR